VTRLHLARATVLALCLIPTAALIGFFAVKLGGWMQTNPMNGHGVYLISLYTVLAVPLVVFVGRAGWSLASSRGQTRWTDAALCYVYLLLASLVVGVLGG
jgi:hypothetical protein